MASSMTFMDALGLPTRGDIDSFVNVYLNISGTVIAVIFALQTAFGKYEHDVLLKEIIYQKVLAGMTVTMLFGSAYYSWMAIRLKRKTGRVDVTALPYGISTPAAFAFIFNIMATAASTSEDKYCKLVEGSRKCSDEIIWHAWRVGCIANMIGGLVSTLCGFLGPRIAKLAPTAAMMVALAGIGLTYLGMNQLKVCFTTGFAGLLPLAVAILVFFGGVDTKPIPISMCILLVGSIAGWLSLQGWDGGGTLQKVTDSFASLGFYYPTLLDQNSLEVLPAVLSENLGMIFPVALTGAVGTLLCVNSAADAGDEYSIREAMIVDGLTTIVAAAFGSPLATCVYIGHPQYKAQNGSIYYALFNGLAFTIFAMTGLFAAVAAVLPPYAMAPIILFVGIAINQDMFSACPPRHLPAVILGLFPALADWIKSFWPHDRQLPPEVYALAMGALLIAIIWSSVATFAIDGLYKEAILWTLAGAIFSAVGLIHQPQVGLSFQGFLKGGAPGYQTFAVSPCSFFIGYIGVAITLAGTLWLQHRGSHRVRNRVFSEDGMPSGPAPDVVTASDIVTSFAHCNSFTKAQPRTFRASVDSKTELQPRSFLTSN